MCTQQYCSWKTRKWNMLVGLLISEMDHSTNNIFLWTVALRIVDSQQKYFFYTHPHHSCKVTSRIFYFHNKKTKATLFEFIFMCSIFSFMFSIAFLSFLSYNFFCLWQICFYEMWIHWTWFVIYEKSFPVFFFNSLRCF